MLTDAAGLYSRLGPGTHQVHVWAESETDHTPQCQSDVTPWQPKPDPHLSAGACVPDAPLPLTCAQQPACTSARVLTFQAS